MRLALACALLIVAAAAVFGIVMVQKNGLSGLVMAQSKPTVSLPTASAATTGQQNAATPPVTPARVAVPTAVPVPTPPIAHRRA